jgi:hypothetical protein
MAESTPSALTMLTTFFSADAIETAARQTGFVKRTSKITGKLFLALMTFGLWSDAKTTLAQLAAKAAHILEPLEVSPEALHQRMHKPAVAFLQEMIRQAFAHMRTLDPQCDDGLFAAFPKVHVADSTGFGLPDTLKDTFPGAGGSAAPAGAKIQLVWDYRSGCFEHFALTPWIIPDNKYIDAVVALAHPDNLFLFDLGYFKMHAFARIAAANAYFLSRLNHQAHVFEAGAGELRPLNLAQWLEAVPDHLLEKAICLGAKEQVAARLIAVRVPEAVVNKRRRIAKKNAKKKGYTPSDAHLTLAAWNLFITNVPCTVWTTPTVYKVYPIRWQVELIFKSWKSSLHLATLNATKAEPVLCYLYGRMLLIVLNYMLFPQVRMTLWVKKQRELSLLKCVRHFQALAERWLLALFQSPFELRRFLRRACATAERLTAKASRKRQTTAQSLRETLSKQHAPIELAAVINA